MDSKDEFSEKDPVVGHDLEEITHEADTRIQFAPGIKPHKRGISRSQDVTGSTLPIGQRTLSIAQSVNSVRSRGRQGSVRSIPPVYTEKEKRRRKREQDNEKKAVDIDEHLLPHEEVAARYHTNINIVHPGESQGLTSQQVEQLIIEHGRNILTPVKKTHPIIKYLQYLSSLFNLLLILAGVLEYILLGIDFKDNFENVSVDLLQYYELC
jgi:sodium/potassium-transporting ATPase subunit alpha